VVAVVTPLEGQLLTPSDRGPDVWLDVLAGGFVRLELRESTLPPEPGTEQVWTAADGTRDQHGYYDTTSWRAEERLAQGFRMQSGPWTTGVWG